MSSFSLPRLLALIALAGCTPQPAAVREARPASSTQPAPATNLAPRAPSPAATAPAPSVEPLRPAADRVATAASAPPPPLPSVAAATPLMRDGDLERVTGGAGTNARLPVLIALHGLGDRPENFAPLFDGLTARARVLVLRAPTPYGDGFSWFSPRGSASAEQWAAGLDAAANALLDRVRQLAAHPRVCGQPIVTGFSQGAMLSYALAARRAPVALAVPIAGFLPSPLYPTAGPLPPVLAFHGEADDRVQVTMGASTVAAFARVGGRASLERFAGVAHSISREEQRAVLTQLDRALRETCPAAR